MAGGHSSPNEGKRGDKNPSPSEMTMKSFNLFSSSSFD